MSKVLITGGLGQIGSHIAELCLAENMEVFVIDNLATGREEHLAAQDKLQIKMGSIADKDLVDTCFADFKPDVVVHTAASYKDPNDWYNDTLTNCVGGSNIIKASVDNNVSRFVYFQTALCYGTEPKEHPITLSHKKYPANSSYAITKTANEDFLEISGLDYVTFRLANVIGPRNVSGPLPIFFKRLRDGQKCFVTEARRDFVFVKDLAQCAFKAVRGMGSGPYHFSSGSDIPIIDLYNSVVEKMKINDYPEPELKKLSDDDASSILLDPSKTFEDFGEIEFASLDQIVSDAVEYFEEYGVLGEYTHLKTK